jgi:hypothetical protein
MTKEELAELLEAARRVREKYASTPEKARQLLMDEGVLTENGELTKHYQPPT